MSAVANNSTVKIQQWIQQIFNPLNFSDVISDIQGTSELGDGYVGNIAFVKVTGKKPNGDIEHIDVVVKYGKDDVNDQLRDAARKAYEREIFYYEKLIPEFKAFESAYGVTVFKDMKPKAIGVINNGLDYVLVLENLKTLGYELHDRKVPFDLNHSKLTFSQYAKFHAISMAYQQKKTKKWYDYFDGFDSLLEEMLKATNYSFVKHGEKSTFKWLQDREPELLAKIKTRFPEGYSGAMDELTKMIPKKSALIHGDCWNNNMMFKYPNFLQEDPQHVALLDFQIIQIQSPIFDLSYHLYTTASSSVYDHFEELLKIYHETLTAVLKQFGCDQEVNFSYTDLMDEWKKFSFFGIIMMSAVVPATLVEKDQTLTTDDMVNLDLDVSERLSKESTEMIIERIVAAVKHYFKYSE